MNELKTVALHIFRTLLKVVYSNWIFAFKQNVPYMIKFSIFSVKEIF